MPNWQHWLELKDIFHNDEMPFEEKRDEIVKRIKASSFFDPDNVVITGIVDDLADAEDEYDFDFEWDAFYDLAYANRISVATF